LLLKEIIISAPLFWRKWMAKRNGRIDGKKGIPTIDQNIYPFYEQDLKNTYEASIQILTREWQKKDRGLKEDYCKTCATANNLKERIKEKGLDYKAASDARDKFSDAFSHMHTVPKAYWVLFVFLALCEFPMNSL